MGKWFRRLSFRAKILCTYLVLLLLTIAIFIICYIEGVSSALNYNVEIMRQSNEQMNMSLDTAMGNYSSLNFLHLIDSKINIILHEDTSTMDTIQKYERESYMQNILKLLTVNNPNILRLTILTDNGDRYSSLNYLADDYIENIEEQISRIEWQSRSQKYYTESYSLQIGSNGYTAVTVVHQMPEMAINHNFAYLLVDLDFGAIAKNFHLVSMDKEALSSFAIINEEMVLFNSRNAYINLETEISEADKRDIFQEIAALSESPGKSGDIKLDDISCVAAVLKNEATGWYLIHYIPRQVLITNSLAGMVQMMLWVSGILVFSAVLSLILSKQVSKPIKRLTEVMAQARQGEVKLYEEENNREDEIGQLIHIYNAMGSRINDSITKLYIAQLNQKQTELKMLQFQINPHFLYNSLNTVSAIARLADIEEIPLITESLSDMFRYNIKGSDFVTLGEELMQLKNYIKIQSIRFPERFVVEYDIPKELLGCGMIKFILQPIVENSIQHAFLVKRTKDYLRISAAAEGEQVLRLEIYDDGCGMAPEQVRSLNEQLENAAPNTILGDSPGGIGLANVNARLKNFYGAEYGITVESKAGHNTRILIRILRRE